MEKYLVILEPGEQNWSAYSPDVLGCVATGQTVKETVQRMTEALSWHLQDLSRQGESLPVAQGIVAHSAEINSLAGDLFTLVPVELNRVDTVLTPAQWAYA